MVTTIIYRHTSRVGKLIIAPINGGEIKRCCRCSVRRLYRAGETQHGGDARDQRPRNRIHTGFRHCARVGSALHRNHARGIARCRQLGLPLFRPPNAGAPAPACRRRTHPCQGNTGAGPVDRATGELVLCSGHCDWVSLREGLRRGCSHETLKIMNRAAIASKPERHNFLAARGEVVSIPISALGG